MKRPPRPARSLQIPRHIYLADRSITLKDGGHPCMRCPLPEESRAHQFVVDPDVSAADARRTGERD